MITKAIKYLTIFGVFIFPFVFFKSLAFPLAFSHVVFIFTLIQLLVLLFLFYGIHKGELVLKKSYLTVALVAYIIVLIITAFTGSEVGYSFWSNYTRATGIVTWVHYFSFFFVVSSVFTLEQDWKNIFRALALSGFLLALFSFLGRDGLGMQTFAFLVQGGSFLGNTSYSGAYLLLAFFFSVIGFSLESKKGWKIMYAASLLVIFLNPDLFHFGILNGSVSLKEAFGQPSLFMGMARTSSIVLWAGILLSCGVYLVHKLKNKKIVLMLSASLLAVMFVGYIYGFVSLMGGQGKIHDFYVEQSGQVRPMVWHMAVQGIKERPLLGYGDGNFKYVYQKYVDTQMIHLEDPPWFDRAHNFTLEELVGHGVLGAVIMLGIFLCSVFISFKLYAREKRFFFLLIPFVFFLHFLQMQTFFQIDSTLFLTFLLLAFLVSRQDSFSVKIPWHKYALIYYGALFILALVVFIFFVCRPIKENRLIPLIKNTPQRSERLKLQKGLDNLHIDPAETLRQVSFKFSIETATRAEEIQKAGFINNVAEEYRTYLKAYNTYLPRYAYSYRYLYEYANLINTAFIFKVNELKKGELLARQALEISKEYPYPYWILAINLYYQGKVDEALAYAKQGYDLDPTIQKSKEVYEALQARVKSGSRQQAFFFLADI